METYTINDQRNNNNDNHICSKENYPRETYFSKQQTESIMYIQ